MNALMKPGAGKNRMSSASNTPLVSFALRRWRQPAGYREILYMAVPLAMSTGAVSLQHFVDRVMLSRFSTESMAAALPASLAAFTLTSVFLGTASYATTFVAQYFGAGRKDRVGPAIWQAIWFSLAATLLLPLFALLARPYFNLIGHEEAVRTLETGYFRILILGGGLPVYCSALSSFYTGRGRNWTIMWVNVGITVVNVWLNYALIFGNWGFPEMGIRGAGIATVAATFCGAAAYTFLLFGSRHAREFSLLSGWRPDRELFGRLMRFGLPSGLQMTLDVMAFTFFLNLLGKLGKTELAASNIAFSVNMLAFLPMVGFAIATSATVGQYLGKNEPDLATRANWSSFHLALSYTTLITLFYVFTPSLFIAPFRPDPEVEQLTRLLLYFVAAYCLFDTLTIVFSSTLKGAGDTRFVMIISLSMGWGVMFLPSWIMVRYFGMGVFTAWSFLTACVVLMGFTFLARFLRGAWRDMRVIEQAPGSTATPPTELPDAPTVDPTI